MDKKLCIVLAGDRDMGDNQAGTGMDKLRGSGGLAEEVPRV